MTAKMTPILPNPNPTSNRTKTPPKNPKNQPMFLQDLQGRIEGRIDPFVMTRYYFTPKNQLDMTLESLSSSSAAVAATTLLLLDQYSSSVDDFVFSFLIHPWLQRCRINRFYAERRRYYERKKWSVFSERLTERQFVRYFRMSKGLFEKLCD